MGRKRGMSPRNVVFLSHVHPALDDSNVVRPCREALGADQVLNIGFLTNRGTGQCGTVRVK